MFLVLGGLFKWLMMDVLLYGDGVLHSMALHCTLVGCCGACGGQHTIGRAAV